MTTRPSASGGDAASPAHHPLQRPHLHCLGHGPSMSPPSPSRLGPLAFLLLSSLGLPAQCGPGHTCSLVCLTSSPLHLATRRGQCTVTRVGALGACVVPDPSQVLRATKACPVSSAWTRVLLKGLRSCCQASHVRWSPDEVGVPTPHSLSHLGPVTHSTPGLSQRPHGKRRPRPGSSPEAGAGVAATPRSWAQRLRLPPSGEDAGRGGPGRLGLGSL